MQTTNVVVQIWKSIQQGSSHCFLYHFNKLYNLHNLNALHNKHCLSHMKNRHPVTGEKNCYSFPSPTRMRPARMNFLRLWLELCTIWKHFGCQAPCKLVVLSNYTHKYKYISLSSCGIRHWSPSLALSKPQVWHLTMIFLIKWTWPY